MTPVQTAKRIGRGTLKRGNWVQLLQFGLVGASGYIVNLAVFAVLVGPLNVHHIAAAILAFGVAVMNNFWWNRHWTFDAKHGHAGFQAARFFTVSVLALVINLVVARAPRPQRDGRHPLAGDRGGDRDAVQLRRQQAVDVRLGDASRPHFGAKGEGRSDLSWAAACAPA